MWTIPDAADLEGIVFQPPPYWSGELTLNLTAVAYELINGDQAFESLSFDIEIVPVVSQIFGNILMHVFQWDVTIHINCVSSSDPTLVASP